ncbi:MAG: polyprenyl synthetase family protein [Muribaculaceae bacterium]|jgi:octaprenyl-diphosphate synthase|nr:polyprenyl synthetase family protein [Muribaculaceae bacterium]MEE1338314.1 polyprenyl synthetase family protein [Muribaculaceae bacterium]
MGEVKKIQENIADDLSSLNDIIKKALESNSALMHQIVSKFLESKGKQIRPILVILSGRFFGGVNNKVLNAGAAIELLHNASLIHDDVIDESKERRGKPTINRIWDNHISVLVGDFFVSAALHCAVQTENHRITAVLSRLGRELSLGEMDQIDNARQHSIDEESYFNIIKHKTASLFKCCVEVSGHVNNANEKELADLMQFTEILGLCFQIKDDIFDYFEDKAIGKPTGNDLREGKVTLPLIYALSKKDAPQHNEMVALAKKNELSNEEIATLIEFAKNEGGIEYAYATMERLRNEAFAILDSYRERPVIDDFKTLFNYIIARNK